MTYKQALLGAFIMSAASVAHAQTTETEDKVLDIVIVEGSRLNQTETEIGSSVSIISADDIELIGYQFALDAVAAAPGATINQNGAFGGLASVRIRGASSEQTLVLIDGVPVTDPSSPGGGFNFARLDTANIERIEVLKGPQSTLWGSDAIGGVVSITTKKPDDGLGGNAFVEYGSFNFQRAGAAVEAGGEIGDFRFSATSTSTDGISKADKSNGNSERDGYDAVTLAANGGLNLGPARLSSDVMWTDAEADFDSFVFGSQGNVGDGDEVSETEELSTNITLDIPLFNDRFDNAVVVGYSDIDRQSFSNGAPSFGADGERWIYRYQGNFELNGANTLAFGVEREETTANDDETSIDSLFALYEFKPFEKLTLTGGVRVDDHEKFGSETTGRVAAAYNVIDSLTIRGSWGQGFKAPTIFQSTYICGFCGLTEPNSDLQPETSEAFEIGLDWRSSNGLAEAGIVLFDQESENLIDFTFTAGYDNVALVESQGVEIYGGYRVADWLNISGNYAYIDAEEGDGAERTRLPEHSGDVTFGLNPEGRVSGAVLVRYNGEELNTNGATLDSWTRVDVSGSFAVTDSVEFYGRIENLFDEDYQQILGYGTPGMSGRIGLRLVY